MRGVVWPLVPLPDAHVRRVWGEGHKGIRQVKPAPQTDQQLVSLGRREKARISILLTAPPLSLC